MHRCPATDGGFRRRVVVRAIRGRFEPTTQRAATTERNSARAGMTGSGVIRHLAEAIRLEGWLPATAVQAAILRDVWLHDARLPSPNAGPRAILCRMKRAVVIAALLVCSPAVVRGEDRTTMSSEDLVRGMFCTSPKDHSDCLEGCALRLKEMQRYRACTAACTSLYCPRK